MGKLIDEIREITNKHDNYKTLYDDVVNYIYKSANNGNNTIVYLIDGVTYSTETYKKAIKMLEDEGFNCLVYNDYPGYTCELRVRW